MAESNMKVLYRNVGPLATLTASSEAGELVVENLQNYEKSGVWRSTELSATLTAIFPTPQMLDGVWLVFANLTATATIQVLGYEEVTDETPLFDTGEQLAVGYAPFGAFGFGTETLGVNFYSYGGFSYAGIWFPTEVIRKVVIQITDANNPSGYMEVATLVMGQSWSPADQCDYGLPVTNVDNSVQLRDAAGNNIAEQGTVTRRLKLDLSQMNSTDRALLDEIQRANGKSTPMLVSVFPATTDTRLRQTYTLWGMATDLPATTYPGFEEFSGALELEEM